MPDRIADRVNAIRVARSLKQAGTAGVRGPPPPAGASTVLPEPNHQAAGRVGTPAHAGLSCRPGSMTSPGGGVLPAVTPRAEAGL